MADKTPTIRVNRAPVLTLWAAIVAERLGHPPDTALSLASAVAGTAARAKARRLGLAEEQDNDRPRAPAASGGTARLLGREILLTHDENGVVLADAGGRPAPVAPVAAYVQRAFSRHLPEVRRAMEELASRFEPEELNRIGFRLYERFRPDVPTDVRGWGAKGELHLQAIRNASE